MIKASRSNLFYYNPNLKDRARNLRNNMTKAEACVWKYLLCDRTMKGYQFRRQRPILNYIADFVCLDLLLVIEIDGMSHDSEEAFEADQQRDENLAAIGFTLLRFSNWQVLYRMEEVAIEISNWINLHAIAPPPGPRKRNRKH